MKLASFIMGVLVLLCIRIEVQFESLLDVIAVMTVYAIPLNLIVIPLILEYKSRKPKIAEKSEKRKIIAAAIQLQNGAIICGMTHGDAYMALKDWDVAEIEGYEIIEHKTGFIDNEFNYLTREEARIIAIDANQIDPDNTYSVALHSEDFFPLLSNQCFLLFPRKPYSTKDRRRKTRWGW